MGNCLHYFLSSSSPASKFTPKSKHTQSSKSLPPEHPYSK